MEAVNTQPRFAVCINNSSYPDDLKVRTVYQILPDESAARSNYVRVIDETGEGGADGRPLPRVAPGGRVWAAVDNETRDEMLGMAEVSDFSGLGMSLRGMPGDPVAAAGDRLWVTLIAEEGVIPLRATLVHVRREGVFGLKVDVPGEAEQHFLLRLYEHSASRALDRTRATD